MELRHLYYFIAVAEELNFSRAALRLHIAQPPLSRQIRQLEEEIGADLFTRDRKRVALTPAGTVFLQESRNLIGQLQSALEVTRNAAKGSLDVLRLGISGGVGSVVLTFLQEYMLLVPGLNFECRNLYSTLQNAALRERQIDVGFMRPPVDAVHLTSFVLFEEQLQVVFPRKHRLAGQPQVSIKDLAQESILLHERATSSGVYDKIIDLFRFHDIAPKIINTATGPYEEAGRVLIASGKGVALGVGAGLYQPTFNRDLIALPVADAGASIEVRIAFRKDEHKKEVLAFVNFVHKRRNLKP